MDDNSLIPKGKGPSVRAPNAINFIHDVWT